MSAGPVSDVGGRLHGNSAHTGARPEKLALAGDWLLVALWMAAIFLASYLTTVPGPLAEESARGSLLRHSGHTVEYAVLGALAYRAVWRSTAGRAGRVSRRSLDCSAALLALGLALAYGLFDEWHQSYLPDHGFSAFDVGLDMAAAGLAIGLAVGLPGLAWLTGPIPLRGGRRDRLG